MRLSFGKFIADFSQRCLSTGDREIRLAPKAFDLLQLLIENRPRAIAKAEIFAHLWPGTFVTENNLATLIADLRAAVGDDAREPHIIRTAYAFGYAFVAPVAEAAAAVGAESIARWALLLEDREIALPNGSHILGRTGPGVVVLDFPTVSRHHARLTLGSGSAVIEDLGSKNGTWADGTPVDRPTAVRDGGEIRLGSLALILRARPLPASTVSTERATPGSKT
jgi:DNA-binding winged helix-turn-helix (wHTH) protein